MTSPAAVSRVVPVSGRESAEDRIRSVYVWQVPVRLTHWAIVLAILAASFSGFFIANPPLTLPGSSTGHVTMSVVKLIHSWAAIVFIAALLARVWWGFTGNRYARWSSFLPTSKRRWANLFGTLRFYLFLRPKPPATVGHNGLASLTYLVVFGLYGLMIGTGLALRAASASATSYLQWFRFFEPLFGGLATARFLHHIGMWLLLGFFAHHVWSAFLVSNVEKNSTLESIFSGYKTVPREHIDQAE